MIFTAWVTNDTLLTVFITKKNNEKRNKTTIVNQPHIKFVFVFKITAQPFIFMAIPTHLAEPIWKIIEEEYRKLRRWLMSTYGVGRSGSCWPGNAVCRRRRCTDTGACRGEWVCHAGLINKPHTRCCCHCSHPLWTAQKRQNKQYMKSDTGNILLPVISFVQHPLASSHHLPLSPGCSCFQCHKSPAADNSHGPPEGLQSSSLLFNQT